MAYAENLASRGPYRSDITDEKEGRESMRPIPLGFDASTRRWTTAQGVTDLANGMDSVLGGLGRIEGSDIVTIFETWLARQGWATSGSASGFSLDDSVGDKTLAFKGY